MRTAKLHIVRPHEAFPAPQRQVDWMRRLRLTGMVVWWVLWIVWQVVKMVMVVALFTASAALIMIGVLAHFVQGPPQR